MPRNPNMPRVCEFCGATFYIYESALKYRTARFCSSKCMGESRRGISVGIKTGRYVDRGRARVLVAPGTYMYEHRYVMEQHLGRPLRSDEHVHHIDGNPLNNDISNLQIMDPGEHISLHHRGADRKNGRWGKHSDACIECGTTEIHHHGNGLCHNCYSRGR